MLPLFQIIQIARVARRERLRRGQRRKPWTAGRLRIAENLQFRRHKLRKQLGRTLPTKSPPHCAMIPSVSRMIDCLIAVLWQRIFERDSKERMPKLCRVVRIPEESVVGIAAHGRCQTWIRNVRKSKVRWSRFHRV